VSTGRRGWTGDDDIGAAAQLVSAEGELGVQRHWGNAEGGRRQSQGEYNKGMAMTESSASTLSIGYNDNRTEAELSCFRELWSWIIGQDDRCVLQFCLYVLTISLPLIASWHLTASDPHDRRDFAGNPHHHRGFRTHVAIHGVEQPLPYARGTTRASCPR
jgi:hypothetical protein